MVVKETFFLRFQKMAFSIWGFVFFLGFGNSHFKFFSFFGFSEMDLSFSFFCIFLTVSCFYFFQIFKNSFFFIRFFGIVSFFCGVFLSFLGIFKKVYFQLVYFPVFQKVSFFSCFLFSGFEKNHIIFWPFFGFFRNSPF